MGSLINWIKDLFTKKEDSGWLKVLSPDDMEYYDYSSLKDLEDQIVDDAVNGRLRIKQWTSETFVSTDFHCKVLNRDIRVRVDFASIGGTFSFITVQGRELSYEMSNDFDIHRVIRAITRGVDQPTTHHSLWHC